MIKQCLVGFKEYVAGTPGTIQDNWFGVITEEGVKLILEVLKSEKKNYLSGDGTFDEKVNGMNISVELNLEDYDKEQLAKVLPYCTHDVTTDTLHFDVANSYSFRQNSKILCIHPIEATDDSDDIVLYKTGVSSGIELVFHGVEDQPYQITIKAYPVIYKDANGKIRRAYGKHGAWEADFIAKQGKFFDNVIYG